MPTLSMLSIVACGSSPPFNLARVLSLPEQHVPAGVSPDSGGQLAAGARLTAPPPPPPPPGMEAEKAFDKDTQAC